jgi:division/cell wall cluster transcriptional repressor MraZ
MADTRTQAPESDAQTPASAGRRATFFGTAYHKVSSRNQVAIPKHFANVLKEANEGQLLLLHWGEEGHLRLYTQTRLDEALKEIQQNERLPEAARKAVVRKIAASASVIEPDGQGRFVLPGPWVDKLGLQNEVAFCGAFSLVEIWPAQARRDYEEKEAAALAEVSEEVTRILDF